jgi:hypothetical protein
VCVPAGDYISFQFVFMPAATHAASLPFTSSPSTDRTLMDDMIAVAAQASKEQAAQKQKSMSVSFGSSLPSGFLGVSSAPAVVPQKQCDSCGTAGTAFKKCSRCKMVKYCSETCQRAHWPVHKSRCGKACLPVIRVGIPLLCHVRHGTWGNSRECACAKRTGAAESVGRR